MDAGELYFPGYGRYVRVARNYSEHEAEIKLAAAEQHISKLNARIKQMNDQHKVETDHLKEEITRLRHMEDSARSLCTAILSKDRSELVLGTDYTWNKVQSEDLIHKALQSFKNYCITRTKDMQKLKDYAVQKNDELIDAQDKIQELSLNQTSASQIAGVQEMLEKKLKDSENKFAKAYEGCAVQYDEEEEATADKIVGKVAKSVADDYNKEQQARYYKNGAFPNTGVRSPEAEKRAQMKKKAEIDNIDSELTTLAADLSEQERAVIQTMGRFGISLGPEIRKNVEMSQNKFSETCKKLNSKNLITCEKVILPVRSGGTPQAYVLTPRGEKIYKHLFGEYPAEGEATKIKRYHANLEHGYGIKSLRELLVESKRYGKVNMFEKPVSLGKDISYQPDILATFKRNSDGTYNDPDYFEYERVKQTPEEYFAKFNKMSVLTNGINVVVSSSNDHKKMQSYLYKWAQKNKSNPDYADVIIRLTSITVLENSVKTKNFNDWWVVNSHISRFPPPES